jgi:hypothetical protein
MLLEMKRITVHYGKSMAIEDVYRLFPRLRVVGLPEAMHISAAAAGRVRRGKGQMRFY